MKLLLVLLTITLSSSIFGSPMDGSPIDQLPPSLTLNEWYELGNTEMTNLQNMMKFFGQPYAVYDNDFLLSFDICTVSGSNKGELLTISLFEGVEHSTNSENLDCFKKALKQIDPSSELVKDFDVNSMTISAEICKKKIKDPKYIKYIKSMLGEMDIHEYTCGAVTMKKLQTVGYRMPILKFGNVSEEIKKSEFKHVNALISGFLKKAFNCQIGKVDKM
ncbi:hypothetical protein PVAND_015484 [Polypedilum vanderplanki]|uniref:DUF5442 domain-containing protein n=1 Tax=Polypedilum vanderplanki TaxID=319348 RepID=A0A9J6BCA9_POLVA|nr:hypothetical protein PVAND_015484 [Polypedilum vanderplanki]